MLNHRPCVTCKEDTLHYSTKCRQCGTVNMDCTGAVSRGLDRVRTRYMAKGERGKEQYYQLRESIDYQRAAYLKRDGKRFVDTPLRRGERSS